MALITLRCPENHGEWDTITGDTVSFTDDCCSICGKKGVKVISGAGVYHRRAEMEDVIARGEYSPAMQNKKILESDETARKILSGEIGLQAGKDEPKELIPQCPEHLRKRWY